MLRALREQNRIVGNKENRAIRANKGVTEALAKEYIRDYHKDINKARDVEVKLTRQLAAKEQALKGYKYYLNLASSYRSDIAQCEREGLWDMIKSYYEKADFYLGKAEEYKTIILTSYLKDSEIKVPKW